MLARAGVGRGRHRTPRRPGRGHAARRRGHRRGDQPQPGEEPARPLRFGRQQRRPFRCVRARRHPAHRPGPAAPAACPTAAATVALRQTCRARKDLVAHRVAVANQLRAHLNIVFPGAVGLFADLDSPISLAFLTRFDCQDRADWLSPTRLGAWLATVGYSGRTDPADAAPPTHRRAPRRHRQPTAPPATSPAPSWPSLSSLAAQITALDAEIADQLARHADAQIFTRLPALGHRPRRAPAQPRSATAEPASPPQKPWPAWPASRPPPASPGKSRTSDSVGPADKQLREAVTDFAGDSRRANPWAADLYTRARARGHDHPHAVRILARAWLYVIWHCWQDGRRLRPRPNIAPSRHCSTKLNTGRLDTGQLMRRSG